MTIFGQCIDVLYIYIYIYIYTYIHIYIYRVGVLQLPSNKKATADNGALSCLFIFMAAVSAGVYSHRL